MTWRHPFIMRAGTSECCRKDKQNRDFCGRFFYLTKKKIWKRRISVLLQHLWKSKLCSPEPTGRLLRSFVQEEPLEVLYWMFVVSLQFLSESVRSPPSKSTVVGGSMIHPGSVQGPHVQRCDQCRGSLSSCLHDSSTTHKAWPCSIQQSVRLCQVSKVKSHFKFSEVFEVKICKVWPCGLFQMFLQSCCLMPSVKMTTDQDLLMDGPAATSVIAAKGIDLTPNKDQGVIKVFIVIPSPLQNGTAAVFWTCWHVCRSCSVQGLMWTVQWLGTESLSITLEDCWLERSLTAVGNAKNRLASMPAKVTSLLPWIWGLLIVRIEEMI